MHNPKVFSSRSLVIVRRTCEADLRAMLVHRTILLHAMFRFAVRVRVGMPVVGIMPVKVMIHFVLFVLIRIVPCTSISISDFSDNDFL